MLYAIELYFDKETEQSLLNLAKEVADKNLSTKFLEWKTRPHLTLGCFHDVEEQKCARQLEGFAKNHEPIAVCLASVGMFVDTRAIFASPVITEHMYRLQRELHECLTGYDTTGWEWYCPDNWVPHCTLAMTGEDEEDVFYQASDLILHKFKKIWGSFVSVGLVKVTFPVEELYTFPLNRSDSLENAAL